MVNHLKRDMELMRKILFVIEEHQTPGSAGLIDMEVESYSKPVIAEHCELLYQAGLVSSCQAEYADNEMDFFVVGKLTNEGHDYLELIRNEETWDKTKEEMKNKKLPVTIESISKIAAEIAEVAGRFLKGYNG